MQLLEEQDIDFSEAMERLQRVAAEVGVPWRDRTRTSNSCRALELGKWAESLNRGDEYHSAVYSAYFARNLDIDDISVLQALAESIGLDGCRAEEVLVEGVFRDAVESDLLYSRDRGISVVPTFLAGERTIVGAQPYRVLEELLSAAGARARK